MRLFIAIEMNDEIRETASGIIAALKKTGADVKWVEKQNLHMTLKFLGEQAEESLPKIKESLSAAASKSEKFNINISGIGTFPGGKFIRVIWLGSMGEIEKAKLLAQNIDTELSLLGIEKEKREFAAHLTLGRARTPKNADKLSEEITKINKLERKTEIPAGVQLAVTQFTLFQSKLSPKGPTYTAIEKFMLR